MRQGIYGHTSLETAYMIEDYPYGRLRCRRRVWLESDPKKGYRFVSQTENPKTGRWNKPHKSTYVNVAACLYLDADEHVVWTGVGTYTNAQEALSFARDFGKRCEGTEALLVWAKRREEHLKALVGGWAFWTVNGVKQPRTDHDNERDSKEAQVWAEVVKLLSE